MDFYADKSLGPWTPRYKEGVERTRAPRAGAQAGEGVARGPERVRRAVPA